MEAKEQQVGGQQEDYIFRSKLPDIDIPSQLPLHGYCFERISEHSDRPCLIDGSAGRTYTYSEVDLARLRVASGLHRLGINKGDVVMLLLHNSPEFVFSFLGASTLGVITTTANPLHTPKEISQQAAASGAKLIVTHLAYASKVKELEGDKCSTVIVTDDDGHPSPADLASRLKFYTFSQLIQQGESTDLPEVEIEPDDIVALPFSSGTTGLPKGVMLTHKSIVTSVAQQMDGENPNLYFHRDDVILAVLPMFHIYCLNSILLCGLRAGATILIMQRFDVTAMMELVAKHRVTIAPWVPPILLAITKSSVTGNYDVSSVRLVISGAAPMGAELEEAVRARFPNATLGQGYGMTEANAVSLCLGFAKEPFPAKSGSCGTVIRNAQLKIVDPGTGASLPPNRRGEICVKGKQIMKGYLYDPEATKNTIDDNGWLHTGDIGYVDDDNELFIVDRLKELIKYKGYQVAPAELEALLVAHPNISDAAVVPLVIRMKDDAAGEVPIAFVVKSNGSQISEDDIKLYVAEQVIFYKRIAKVFFIDSIPKARSGKILRKDLRVRLANGIHSSNQA